MDWKGMEDSTPCSRTDEKPNNPSSKPAPSGDAWKGLPDSTPGSRPVEPGKQ